MTGGLPPVETASQDVKAEHDREGGQP